MCCGVTLSWPLRWPRAALYQGGTVWGVLISQGVVSSQAKKTRFLALSGVFQFQDSLLCTPPGAGGEVVLGTLWGQGWVPNGSGVGYLIGLGTPWGLGWVPHRSGLGIQWGWGWVSHWVGYPIGSGLGTPWCWDN